MSKSLLDSYVKDTITLAKTMVIKSQESADGINEMLVSKGHTVLPEPETWKYYLNLAGIRHDTDPVISIVSLDDGTEISPLSAKSLEGHPATKAGYWYGTRYYTSLVTQYPEMESFILGCLMPVSLNLSTTALNGTILIYPLEFIEEQETTLIDELQGWVDSFNFRWHVKAFAISDNLYRAAQHGIMYLNLVPRLFNLRLKRCKTGEAHSFHITMHLASHNGLDVYMPYLTLKQKLWLYRNIEYVERHAGQSEVLKTLTHRLLTERMIPIEEFSLRYLSEIVNDGTEYTGTNLKYVRRKALNTLHNAIEEPHFTIERLLEREVPNSVGNRMFLTTSAASIYNAIDISRSSVVQTKVLDSSMIDYSNETPDVLVDVLLRNWVMMANRGLYTTEVQWQDPVSSKYIKASALDAFVYMWYIQLSMVMDVTCQAKGMEYVENYKYFPRYINNRQRRQVLPTLTEMYSLIHGDTHLTTYASKLIARQPKITPCHSVTSFYRLAKSIFDEHQTQRFDIAAEEDLYRRAEVEAVTTWFYEDEYVDWSFPVIPVKEWLALKGFPAYSGDIEKSVTLATDIFLAGTGMDGTDYQTLRGIQGAMLSVLSGLSSYSVQFLKSINDTDIIPLNYPVIRSGNVNSYSHDVQEIEISPGFIHMEAVAKTYLSEEITVETPVVSSKVYAKCIPLSVSMGKEMRYDNKDLVDCRLSVISVKASYPGYSSAISLTQAFIGYEQFEGLSLAQKLEVFKPKPTPSQTTGLPANFTGTVTIKNPNGRVTVYTIPTDTLADVQTNMLSNSGSVTTSVPA